MFMCECKQEWGDAPRFSLQQTQKLASRPVVIRQRREKDAAKPACSRLINFTRLTAAVTKQNWECWVASAIVKWHSNDFCMEHSDFLSPGRTLMSEGMERDRLAEEIVLLALFLVSTAANSLALLVFCRRPGLRTISNR